MMPGLLAPDGLHLSQREKKKKDFCPGVNWDD